VTSVPAADYNAHMTNAIRSSVTGAGRNPIVPFALALLAASCQSKPAPPPVTANAWAVVDGREITRDDVEKAFRRRDQAAQPLGEEEAAAAKLAILDDLISQDLILAKVRELKIELPDSELDTAYLEARKNISDEAFKQELSRRQLTPADMRESMRRDLLVQKLLEREVASKITVTDQEISTFYEANKAQFNRTEDAYRVAQILVTPVREAQVANRTGSDATTPQEAAEKTKMVMDRLKAGAEFGQVAADFSEDAESAPRGGDLGFVPLSAVQKLPPPLRDAVLNGASGSARLITVNGASTIVVVLGKDPAGQKTLGTPGLKESISQGLRGRREQLLRLAYLANLRNGAVVSNVAAKRLVESPGKMPSLFTAPMAGK
jgi:peptidyl-prolyl cis-trans isomerase SurA